MALQLLNQLHFVCLLAAAELRHEFPVLFLAERQLADLVKHELGAS